MSWKTLAVVGVLVGAIAGAVIAMVVRFQSHMPQWVDLPNGPPKSAYVAPAGYDSARIVASVEKCLTVLPRHTKWTVPMLFPLAEGLHIEVKPTPDWVDFSGQSVAGLQAEEWLVVGSDLAALCHEFIHWTEWALEKRTDYAHEGWADAGILAAIDEYDAWLPHPDAGVVH